MCPWSPSSTSSCGRLVGMDVGASSVCKPCMSRARQSRGSTAVMGGKMGRKWGRAAPWSGTWAWQTQGKLERRKVRYGVEARMRFIAMSDEMRLSWRGNPMLVLMDGLGCRCRTSLQDPRSIPVDGSSLWWADGLWRKLRWCLSVIEKPPSTSMAGPIVT